KLIEIAEMVFAELARGISEGFQQLRNRRIFCLKTNRCCWHADFRQARSKDALARDERRPSRSARLFPVRVCEHHPFTREAVDVRRLVAHQTVRVAAEVGDADVVSPDHENVGLSLLRHSVTPSRGWFLAEGAKSLPATIEWNLRFVVLRVVRRHH